VEETGYAPKIVEELQADYIRLKEKDLNLPARARLCSETFCGT
jgi:hypothetical protein